MKRILFLHQVSYIGGASYCLLNLLKEINRNDFEPLVLLANKGPLEDEITKLGIQVYYMPNMSIIPYNQNLLSYYSITAYFKAFRSRETLKRILCTLKPDIMYLNNVMLYPYLKVGHDLGVKTVIHIREHWPLDEHRFQLKWLIDNVRRYSNKVIAINTYSATMVSGIENKTTIVYDWIDFTGRYKEHNLDEIIGEDASKLKVFVYTGGLQTIKGGLEVFEVFSKYKKENYRLLAIGVNTDISKVYGGLLGKIKRVMAVLGIKAPGIKMINAVNKDKDIIAIPATYYIKDLIEKSYCMLSYFTIPHANLAMAESIVLKTPVIAANTPESVEYSCGGQYAWLFPFKDKAAFINCFTNIDKCYGSMKESLNNGSIEVANMFDKNRNAEVFRKVLSSIE